MTNLRRLTFSSMRDLILKSKSAPEGMFYLSNELFIGQNLSKIFRQFLDEGVPFLVDDGRIGLVTSGYMRGMVNLVDEYITAGTLVYLGPGSIVQINEVSEDMHIEGLVLREDFLNVALHGHLPHSFLGGAKHIIMKLEEPSQTSVASIMRLIWNINRQVGHKSEALHGLIYTIFHYFDFLKAQVDDRQQSPRSREREIFERFVTLVNEHCRSERSMEFYADKLCITPRYLGSMIKKASGQTAKEWIDRAVVTAAKVMLCHTDKPISTIAYELNFPNDSFFCKYFNRLEGTTPAHYRDRR